MIVSKLVKELKRKKEVCCVLWGNGITKGKRHRRNKLNFYSLSIDIVEIDNEIICEVKSWLYLLIASYVI